jgi:hypothetical protein
MANKSVGFLTVAFGADLRGFDKAMKKATRDIKRFGTNMKNVGQDLTRNITLPVVALGGASVKLASDFNESLNKVQVSFGDSSKSVEDFAKTTLESFGIARGSALEMAALFGDMGTSLGMSQQEAANMATSLVGLAGDLASFKNVQIEVAQTALAGIFTGETESLKKLGIMTTEATLKNNEYFLSLGKSFSELTQLEKIQIRYAEVLRQSTNAVGDFERTSEGFANQMRMLQESMKETGEEIGQKLIPFAQKLINEFNKLLTRLNNLTDAQKDTLIQFSLLAAAIGPILSILGNLINIIGKLLPLFLKLKGGLIALAFAGASLEKKLKELGNKAFIKFVTRTSEANKEVKAFTLTLDKLNKIGKDIGKDKSFRFFEHKGVTPSAPSRGGMMQTIPSIGLQPLPIKETTEELNKVNEQFTLLNENTDQANMGFALFGDVVRDSMNQALNGTQNFFEAFMESLKQMIKRLLIQLAIMTAIRILMGDSVGLALSTAKEGLAKNLGFGEFANGGIISGPTLGLMGEYAGANSNPEVVAPLSKLKSMIGGGTQQVEVVGRISGTDIFLSNARTSGNRLRSV